EISRIVRLSYSTQLPVVGVYLTNCVSIRSKKTRCYAHLLSSHSSFGSLSAYFVAAQDPTAGGEEGSREWRGLAWRARGRLPELAIYLRKTSSSGGRRRCSRSASWWARFSAPICPF